MKTVRTFASFALAAALAGSSFAFAADTAAVKHGRDSVYASNRAAPSSVAAGGDLGALQQFGREGGIPLSRKLATGAKPDVKVGGTSLPQRFGRA